MSYTIAVGADQAFLNQIISSVHSKVYPKVFTQTIDITGKGSITFDMYEPPKIVFGESNIKVEADSFWGDLTKRALSLWDYFNDDDEAEEGLENQPLSATDKEDTINTLESIAAATLGLEAKIKLSGTFFGYDIDIADALCAVYVNIGTKFIGDDIFYDFDVVDLIIDSDWDRIDAVLEASSPRLINLFNTYLEDLKMPVSHKVGDLELASPIPSVQAPNLVVYSSLFGKTSELPTGLSWPSGAAYVGIDKEIIEDTLSNVFPITGKVAFNEHGVSGGIHTYISTPQFNFGADGQITSTIVAGISGRLGFSAQVDIMRSVKKFDFFGFSKIIKIPSKVRVNHSFNLGTSLEVSVSITPIIIDNVFYLSVSANAIPQINMHIPLSGLPAKAFNLLGGSRITHEINKKVRNLVKDVIVQLPPVKITKLPEIDFELAGEDINIILEEGKVSSNDEMIIISSKIKLE